MTAVKRIERQRKTDDAQETRAAMERLELMTYAPGPVKMRTIEELLEEMEALL